MGAVIVRDPYALIRPYGHRREITGDCARADIRIQLQTRGRRYFFFCEGAKKSRVAAAGLGFSAFGLRISRLLFF
jgi:hypothetical protein